MIPRISTTTLESFRRVQQTEYGSEAELIASIKRSPVEPSWQMQAGSAWHAILERPMTHCVEGLDDNGQQTICFRSGVYIFSPMAVEAALAHVGNGIREAKATTEIGGAVIVAQVDQSNGLVVQENKARFGIADARDYEASLQWRFYLLVHGAKCVRYNVFEFKEPANGYCHLKNILSFKFWPYEKLEEECRAWVSSFLGWAADRQLLPYLTGREAQAA